MPRSNNLCSMPALRLILLLGSLGLFSACSSIIKPGSSGPAAQPAAAVKPQPAKPAPDKLDADGRFNTALDLMKQQQIPEAEKAFGDLARDFPQYSGPLTNLGILYARANQPQQAIGAFSRAVVVNPQNAVAYNWLGVLYRQSGNYPRAEQAYKQALAIDANDAEVHLNLGILYDSYLKRPADALAQYRDYQRLDGMKDLRVSAWIAELEKSQAAAMPAAATKAPAAAAPAPVKPTTPKKQP
ncbi:MAG TPA: tetratricopeptide repeat protein [Stenotrophobium sp.]|nr:tetratricopeptide repeat protein [Stenotrophobium sp.]